MNCFVVLFFDHYK